MSGDEKAKSGDPGQWAEFDLLGDPIPEGFGGKGRPEHRPSREKATLVTLLIALGKSKKQIAAGLGITQPTLNKHYYGNDAPFRVRPGESRERIEAKLLLTTFKQAEKGSVAAIKALWDKLEAADRDLDNFEKPKKPEKPKETAKKLGKKEAELEAAATAADEDPDWGALLSDDGSKEPVKH